MAAPKMRLTKARVNALATPSRPLTVHDDEIAGFDLLILPSGLRTFYLHCRTRDGRQFRMKIGRFHTELTADQARVEARRLRAAIALGRDPAAELQERRQKRKARQAAPTVAELFDAFYAARRDAWRANTAAAYRGWFGKHVAPVLGRHKAHEVTPSDVRRLYRAITRPATQQQVFRTVSAIFSWAVAQDDYPLITVNPCLGAIGPDIKGKGANRREREPEGDELARLVGAIEARGDQVSKFFMLLLLTGCREGELLHATWRELDLDGDRPTWRKPPTGTKTGQPHRVTLSKPAAELLQVVKTAQPFSPFGWLTKHRMRMAWREVCAAAGIADLHVHDLRHWHASLLAAAGFGLLDIGAALGHRSEATSRQYTHMVEARQREAADKLGGSSS